jgi:hypothetical protein
MKTVVSGQWPVVREEQATAGREGTGLWGAVTLELDLLLEAPMGVES